MKQRIRQCFDRGAKTYHLASVLQAGVGMQLSKRLTQISAKNILEIGCGTGLFSHQLIKCFPEASFLLTDISPTMVQICREAFPHINVECMDGEMLALSSSFDLIASNMTLHWFLNIRESFANIINKLVPGGHFVFAMLGENSLTEWRVICEAANLPIPIPNFPSQQMLKNYFPDIQIDVQTIKQPYQNLFDFLKSLKKIGATATDESYNMLNANVLRSLLRKNRNKIDISYEIIYGHYIKT